MNRADSGSREGRLPCAFIKNNLEERVGIMRARVPSRSGSRCFGVVGLLLLSLFSSPLHAQRERPGTIPPWGRVRDAKIMGPDRLVVADEQDARVWLVDAEGRLVMTAGRAGAGPGEFRLVDRLVRLDDSTVAVLDRPNARRTNVRVRRDSLFVIGSDAWDPRAESVCVLGRSLMVAQPNVERSTQLREIGPDGVERRTFARLELETPPSALRETLLWGEVGCSEAAQAVYSGSWYTGEVFRWRADNGTQVWRSQLPAFRKIALSAPNAGTVSQDWRRDGNSQLTHVIPLSADTLLVSAMIFWVGPAKDTATIIGSRYLLDARTGQVLSARDETVRVLDARGAYEAVYTEEPEPKVWIRRRRP
jgi:hypothetical protein